MAHRVSSLTHCYSLGMYDIIDVPCASLFAYAVGIHPHYLRECAQGGVYGYMACGTWHYLAQ